MPSELLGQAVGYAQSVDGLQWHKPALHLVDLSTWHDQHGNTMPEAAAAAGLWSAELSTAASCVLLLTAGCVCRCYRRGWLGVWCQHELYLAR